jgi:hypothetical protein
MGKSFVMKILSVLAVGIVLAHLSPIAAGMLLCIGDGTDPDCCRKPHSSAPSANEAKQLIDGSNCSCCITVDAAPSTAGATSQKASLDILSGSGVPRDGVSAAGTCIAGLRSHDLGNTLLASLRTVVLLI